jgi:antitoxin component YwqK of YwqJK toxin-antitoxin module
MSDEYQRRRVREVRPKCFDSNYVSFGSHDVGKMWENHGTYRYWDEKDRIMTSCQYRYNKSVGVHRTWCYSGGFLQSETHYNNGVKHGTSKRFFWNGMISQQNNWYQGKKHGQQLYYFGPRLRYAYSYTNGIRVDATEYNENGEVINTGNTVKDYYDRD